MITEPVMTTNQTWLAMINESVMIGIFSDITYNSSLFWRKKKFDQIDQKIFKHTNLIRNSILGNFNIHGRPSKSDIFLVTAVAEVMNFRVDWRNGAYYWILIRCNSEHIELEG